jgi:hypothetical protein
MSLQSTPMAPCPLRKQCDKLKGKRICAIWKRVRHCLSRLHVAQFLIILVDDLVQHVYRAACADRMSATIVSGQLHAVLELREKALNEQMAQAVTELVNMEASMTW